MTTTARPQPDTALHRLHNEQGQSPWLDDLRRSYLLGDDLSRWAAQGIRGVTSNPTTFQRAITGSTDYDAQFTALTRSGHDVPAAYWAMVVEDITTALSVLRPVFDDSNGTDGFVSVELAPDLAQDTDASITAALALHDRINAPNLYVKIPATPEGIPAIRALIGEGRNINVTLVFGLTRYAEVIEAYLSGLEDLAHDRGADLSTVASVASFFVSRVDTAVDRRLAQIGTPEAQALTGQAGIAQAKLAYQLFRRRFAGDRWAALVARGARPQRPLWASTGTKNPADPDTRYIDELIGPDTVTTIPTATIAAFCDHGTLARTVDRGLDAAQDVIDRLVQLGVDLDEVSTSLEAEGVASFTASFNALMGVLAAKAETLASPSG